MAKILNVQTSTQQRPKGIIIGSLFPVEKVKGFSLKFKSKVRDEKGDLVDMTGKKLIEIAFGDGFLCVPNSRKREGRRDPDYIVYAYPDAVPFKKE